MNVIRGWGDQQIEEIIGNLLRAGVLLAATVVLIGAAVYLSRNAHTRVDYRVFRGEPTDLRSVPGIIQAAKAGSGRGIIQLGLLILILTPITRVAFSAVAFAIEGDWLYVGITLLVLAILMFSLSGRAP
jgi:uncharacterized membrane protein